MPEPARFLSLVPPTWATSCYAATLLFLSSSPWDGGWAQREFLEADWVGVILSSEKGREAHRGSCGQTGASFY